MLSFRSAAARGYAQHPAARSDNIIAHALGAGVKDNGLGHILQT